jgi:diguanylate cyclase (GGDEF)-like protein
MLDSLNFHEDIASRVLADPFILLDVMPVAMSVIDAATNIVFVNDRLLGMLRQERAEVLGRSALDFVDPRDIKFSGSLLLSVDGSADAVIGPSRIRYVDADGVSHFTQFWAYAAPPELGVENGYILTLTPESVRDVLASAVTSVAASEPLDRTLSAIATSGRAMPLDGIGTVLLAAPSAPADRDRFRVVGEWPIDESLVNSFGTPWRRCLVQNEPQDVFDVSLGDVDARTGAEMAMAGLPSVWVRPICDSAGGVAGVFIVWRRTSIHVNANQEQHIGDAVRLAQLALEQDRQRRELEFVAHRDTLTGVGNRASLNDRIGLGGPPSSVLFVDLDRFKAVNDTFGHAVGDEVIAQAGRRIAEVVRRGDEVYRTGGDEFVVVCDPAMGDEAGIFALADRLAERMTAPFDCSEHRVRIGATIGIASGCPHPEVTRSLQETILLADRAMYVAKDRGRGGVHHADIQR